MAAQVLRIFIAIASQGKEVPMAETAGVADMSS
jgi:hypothetical protein